MTRHKVNIMATTMNPSETKISVVSGEFEVNDQNQFFRAIQRSVESFVGDNCTIFTFKDLNSYKSNRNFRRILKNHGITNLKVVDFEPVAAFGYDFNFNVNKYKLCDE